MPCLLCKGLLSDLDRDMGGLCFKCRFLEHDFKRLKKQNRDAAYNWAIQKALDLAGDITGIEPGSSFIRVVDGEFSIETVDRVKTTVARYVPPELKNDGYKKE